MASKVLAGTYAETVYGLDSVPGGRHTVYTIEYRTSEDSTIVDSGRRVDALPLIKSVSRPGEVHHLLAGAFHETTIPTSERVVTVMVTGRPEIASCAIVGPPGYRPGRQVREPVTAAQFELAVGDLLP